MFGTCAPSFGSGLFGRGDRRTGSGEIDDPRLPKRYEGTVKDMFHVIGFESALLLY